MRVCLVVLGLAACSTRTSVKVQLAAPGLSISSLELAIGWDGHTQRVTSLPPGGGVPQLPGSVLLVLPDMEKEVEVTVQAVDETGLTFTKTASIMSRMKEEVSLSITLESQAAVMDLAMPPPMDLAGADLAMEDMDLASSDLAQPDMANADLSKNLDLLPPPDLLPHNPLVQMGAVTSGNSTLTANLPTASRAGTMLVFTNVFDKATNPNGPNGWTFWAGDSTSNNATMWYLPNNPGGITSVSANVPGATASVGQLSEWDTVMSVDQGNWCWNSNQVMTLTCTTNPTMQNNDLALELVSFLLTNAGTTTFTPSSPFITLADNGSTSTKLHYQFGYALAMPSAAPVTETVTTNKAGTFAGVLLTFH